MSRTRELLERLQGFASSHPTMLRVALLVTVVVWFLPASQSRPALNAVLAAVGAGLFLLLLLTLPRRPL